MVNSEYVFKALSDKTRLKIVKFLIRGEKCVCEIYPHLKITQSTTSTQLKKLEDWNIIRSRRDGKFIYYSIKDNQIRDVFKLLNIDIPEHTNKVKCKNG